LYAHLLEEFEKKLKPKDRKIYDINAVDGKTGYNRLFQSYLIKLHTIIYHME